MAKLIGPIGSKMRGKVGQIVAAKTVGGDTAIRSYQPQVKNPNTLRQRAARGRMACASRMAAVFSEAIAIGYAAFTQGMKMYPRNVFVKTMVAQGSPLTTQRGSLVQVDMPSVEVSKASGIGVLPLATIAAGSTAGTHVVRPTNTADVILPHSDSQLGLVVVLVDDITDPIGGSAIVKTADAEDGVTFGDEMIGKHVYAFYKEMLHTYTDIATDNYPWKYPSATGASAYIGQVQQ